jgi:hypothetical protein
MAKSRKPEGVTEPRPATPNYVEEFAGILAELERVLKEIRVVATARIPRAEAEAKARAWVTATAARYQLNVSCFEDPDPRAMDEFTLRPLAHRGSPPKHDTDDARYDAARCGKDPEGETHNLLALLDAQPDVLRLSAEERRERLAALELERIAIEIIEEWCIRCARKSGIPLARRGEADLRIRYNSVVPNKLESVAAGVAA